MTLAEILDGLILKPLYYLFEFIFSLACQVTQTPGVAIVLMSLVMNILLLPLYRRADQIQADERALELRMEKGVRHIKATFKGDEAFMMLQTFYRQHHYKPLYVLKGMLPLLLEVPFFIAAYRFLSGLTLLQGIPFGPIRDLGRPDASFLIGGITINLLPILMTIINILSGMLYTKGLSLQSKLQLYGMAIIFLVLLYGAPSGLVLYWTLNNLFSLVKNLLTVGREPKEVEMPLSPKSPAKPRNFFLGVVLLALIVGLWMPATVIQASPEEFMRPQLPTMPITYTLYSAVVAFGFFVVWGGVFFLMSTPQRRRIWNIAVWLGVGSALLHVLAFQVKLGNLSPTLVFEEAWTFHPGKIILNLLALAALCALLLWIYRRWEQVVSYVYVTAILAVVVLSATQLRAIQQVPRPDVALVKTTDARIELSRQGRNVVVVMLDRAISAQLPFILNEKPELKDVFDGFTYYPNTVAFGSHTNTSSPSLYGGYEYTPEALNARTGQPLVEKHNEALKLMPELFSREGFKVRIWDPPYANYRWTPDLSIFDAMPQVEAHMMKGFYSDASDEILSLTEATWKRNFIFYGLMRVLPYPLQYVVYDHGHYQAAPYAMSQGSISTQTGYNTVFLDSYLTLTHLSELTEVTDEPGDHLFMMASESTHEPTLLQRPDYRPQWTLNNHRWDDEDEAKGTYTLNDRHLDLSQKVQRRHYHINMASYLELGEWLQHLKDEGVYDQTRIILVSDHGYQLEHFEDRILPNGVDIGLFSSLLYVKDFDAHGQKVDDRLMTAADTPFLAMDGIVESPVNPFTGQPMTQATKDQPLRLLDSDVWETWKNNGERFVPGNWYEVQGDTLDPSAWRDLGQH